jgi:hypothetical protein
MFISELLQAGRKHTEITLGVLLSQNLLSVQSIYGRLVIFFVTPFYSQPVPVHSSNCVKRRIQWHVEECSVALLCYY